MSVLNENQLLGASGAGGDYEIEQSLRFDDGSGSYLSWTPAATGDRQTWTWSGWVKRANLSTLQTLFIAGASGTDRMELYINASDFLSLYMNNGGSTGELKISAKLRDPSAWYHIVVGFDSTQSTSSNRVKLYVNGNLQSLGTASYPALNFSSAVSTTSAHVLGRRNYDTDRYLDGYLGEVNFIDGQALTPDSFGETGTYGEWKPIEYAGTYGTNGFYLPFKQDYTVEGFSTVVYEGNGATQYIGGTGFTPDLVWFKRRSGADNHTMYDVVRGATKSLSSNLTGVEVTRANSLTGFSNDGFVLGNDGITNANNQTFVAWNWDMGGTTASNTSGSITSSVRANQAYGQSIVSYTGTGAAATVGHGLASAPTMVLVKKRSATANWAVYHASLGNTNTAFLNLNNAASADADWNNTTPTSSVVSLGAVNRVNGGGSSTYVAYCFHDVANYSKFGSYTGTGATGNAITTGFAPAFVMIKWSDGVGGWVMYDNTRNSFNPVTSRLMADVSDAETESTALDFDATGFTVNATGTGMNKNGDTYIYAAFADTREYAYWLDQSGNNNDWTSNGGLTESDVMVDSPTNNFATFNPLIIRTAASSSTFSEGNLTAVGASTYSATTIEIPASGKFYAESYVNLAGTSSANVSLNYTSDIQTSTSTNRVVYAGSNGQIKINTTVVATGATYTTGDIIGVAADTINGTVQFFKNNVSQGTATKDVSDMLIFIIHGGNWKFTMNFGQDSSFAGNKTPQGNQDANGIGDFYYAPPTGFLALCTANLPSVDVIPSEHFNPVLYTGDGADGHAITGVGFQPDFVWMKSRSASRSHALVDSVRGRGSILFSDLTGAQQAPDAANKDLVSFDTDGFTVGTPQRAGSTNANNDTIVAWNWKAGGSASSNSNGSITSSVSANPSAGFSIVSYTGNGTSGATVGHGLSSAPELIIIKNRTKSGENWAIGIEGITGVSNDSLKFTNEASNAGTGYFAGASSSTLFTLGNAANSNFNTSSLIAYAFHSVDGYSKVGSYTGNGSADGTFVHCGFKVAYVLIKRTDSAQSWIIKDTSRFTYNVNKGYLLADTSAAEVADHSATYVDIVANGFKLRGSANSTNASGGTYIFLAFAESPFKNTNAR